MIDALTDATAPRGAVGASVDGSGVEPPTEEALAAFRERMLATGSARAFLAWHRRHYPPRPPELESDPRAWHVCGAHWDGERFVPYQRLLWPAEFCAECGWSPTLPVPRLRDAANALTGAIGQDDAAAWAWALARLIEEEASRHG